LSPFGNDGIPRKILRQPLKPQEQEPNGAKSKAEDFKLGHYPISITIVGFAELLWTESAILNLEQGDSVSRWGRLIFHVADVDAFWTHLKEEGFDPERPRDASWGERYFHVLDPDGHELSFARPLQ
jgi:catechol 2,3-dioxygenase-like lactoylglutathione lyase family enzyme